MIASPIAEGRREAQHSPKTVSWVSEKETVREREGGRERAANCFSKYNKIRAEMGSCSRS